MEILGVTKSTVQYLREQIITGKLAPGQKLNEIELSSNLGISRPPLREAFRVLENEHLVLSIPRKGCYVTEVSMEDCRHIYEAREMIECYAIELLKAQNVRDLPEVASAVTSASPDLPQHAYDHQGEIKGSQNPFPDFHIKLVESTGNRWVVHLYNAISSNLARYQYICFVPGILAKVQEEHEQILNFIKRGDYDQAKDLLRSHINSFFKLIENRIGKKEQGQSVQILGT
jgi:DNA-binding GntR family transcriptional regulator